jgi:hypothetical protein
MKSVKLFFRIFFGLLFLAPLIAWVFWFYTPKRKMVVAIIDKTELNHKGQERISLLWILTHERFTKTRTKPYDQKYDYYGFDPINDTAYRLKGLENFTSEKIEELSKLSDVAFFTDTYGMYNNEWTRRNFTEHSKLLYGGMSEQDIEFLQKMKEKKKLILCEFNVIASPTPSHIRAKFESLFSVHWTGWIARYFENLDTLNNKDIPRWVINNYMDQHKNQWPFTQAGMVFVNINDQIEILGTELDLVNPVPQIYTFKYGQDVFNLPPRMKYPYWVDIMTYNDSINHAVSAYQLFPTSRGAGILRDNGIPERFPAVLMHDGADYKFYYFSGDYTDNPIMPTTSYFKGISAVSWLFYNEANPYERKSFFWKYYRPMVTKILNDYYNEIHPSSKGKR